MPVVMTALKRAPATKLGMGRRRREKRKAKTHPKRYFHGNEVKRRGKGKPRRDGGRVEGEAIRLGEAGEYKIINA